MQGRSDRNKKKPMKENQSRWVPFLGFTLFFFAAWGLTWPTVQAAPAAALTTDLPDRVEKVLPGVVNISSITESQRMVFGMEDFFRFWGVPESQTQKQTSLGSGFIIDSEGYVITNSHVVENATQVLVTLVDKRTFPARLVGRDPKLDLALLQIRDKSGKVPAGLHPVALGDSDSVRIAEPVFAVGNPFGLSHTVTMGIISAKNRTIGIGPFDNFLQTDASINPGNSGGPLFSLKSEVIGINTVIYSRTGQSGGLGFAIPVNQAKAVLDSLKRLGRVPRPWLGILGQSLTPAMANYYDLPVSHGVAVYNLVQGGPADRAGLRQGDILLSVQGLETRENLDVERGLAKLGPKDTVELKIRRGRKTLNLSVKLQELPPRLENLPKDIL